MLAIPASAAALLPYAAPVVLLLASNVFMTFDRVMIETFARVRGKAASGCLDLNHTSNSMTPVSLMIPKFAQGLTENAGELRNRDTGMAI